MNSESKSSSLRWAIDELLKQRDELATKLNIAQRREETGSLIEEVIAQKDALEDRISSLEDGLKASSELVDEPVVNLTEKLEKVDDKLEIAQDRLNSLEQEEYLEELGRKLNGDSSDSSYSETEESSDLSIDPINLTDETKNLSALSAPQIVETPTNSLQSLPAPTPVLMKAPTNRIEAEQETTEKSTSRVNEPDILADETNLEQCSPITQEDLNHCANALGIEADFLLNKGIQAVLRMITRNGNKVSFPLEVEQIEKS